MTTVLDSAETASPPAPAGPPRRARLALAAVPWLIPAVVLVAALLDTGTPARDVALYAVYFAVGVVVPGTLVHRALRGSRGNLPEDLGLGAATGLLLVLLGWALATGTGLQVALPAWPLLLIAPFVAVPSLRRHWRVADPRPLPLRWSWIIAATLLLVVLICYPSWSVVPLPPAESYYYPDLLYHLALVHEMTRSMPFQVPQLAGDILRYHYLSDADMAAASMMTGISPVTVLFRLWVVPVAGTAVLVAAALTRELSGKWWAGALAGPAAVVGLPLSMGAALEAFGGAAVSVYSPSQMYAYPLMGLLIALAFDVLRGRPLGWAWVLVFPLSLACAGAKSSVLPPVLAGLLLAGLVVLVRHRRRLPALLAFIGLALAAMLAGLKIFAGGGAGTLTIQPFAVLWWMPPYRETLGVGEIIDRTQPLPLGVANADAAGWTFVVLVLLWWLAAHVSRLVGIAALGARATRRDPSAWLLAGMVAAGVGGAWVFWHPAASQLYFFTAAVPFGIVLTVWYLADHARGWRPVVAGLLAGGVFAVLVPGIRPPARPTLGSWEWVLWFPFLRAAVVAAVVGLLAVGVWRLVSGRFAWRALPVALIAAVLGAGLGAQIDTQVQANRRALAGVPPVLSPGEQSRILLADEMRAALWLADNTGRDDLVATNVHCSPFTWKLLCDARAFWVAGVGGRRTLVESWAYTDQAVAADGLNGKRFAHQPAPYPERFALNERVFTEGLPADVAELRNRYGVKWLFADERAQGGATPRLAESARLRFSAGPVKIYELG